jgi:hypothetical protein
MVVKRVKEEKADFENRTCSFLRNNEVKFCTTESGKSFTDTMKHSLDKVFDDNFSNNQTIKMTTNK